MIKNLLLFTFLLSITINSYSELINYIEKSLCVIFHVSYEKYS